MVAARTDGVNEDTPIPDFVDPVIIIEPVLGGLGDSCTIDFDCQSDLICLVEQCSDPFVAGGWSSVKESPEDSDSQDVLTDAGIHDQLIFPLNFDFESLRAVAYRE